MWGCENCHPLMRINGDGAACGIRCSPCGALRRLTGARASFRPILSISPQQAGDVPER